MSAISALVALLAAATNAAPPPVRWRLAQSPSTGVWGYTRRPPAAAQKPAAAAGVAPLEPEARGGAGADDAVFYVGLNHWSNVQSCAPEDAECARADLFNARYRGNRTAAAAAAIGQWRRWGFTGAGYNSPPEFRAAMPYYTALFMLGADSRGPNPWRPPGALVFPDPWNTSTVASIRAEATRKCAEVRPTRHNNLGYLLTDFPAYDIAKSQRRFGQDWISSLRCSPPAAPGRLRYLAFLRAKYGADAAAVCRAYDLPAAGCAGGYGKANLCPVENMAVPAALADDYAFLPAIADQLYGTAAAAIRACDPEAVILGDTLDVAWTPDAVIEAAARHFDALSIQPSGGITGASAADADSGVPSAAFNKSAWARVHALSGGRPLLVADVGFAFARPPYARVEWKTFASQRAAGAAYRAYVLGAARTPYIIGFQKCEYVDRAVAQPVLGLKEGMLNFNGTEHRPFCGIVAAANAEALRARAALARGGATAAVA
jgi:hypothetical protein